MRTLRLSLIGMVILALLGGLGGVALAQKDELAELVFVTGKQTGLGDAPYEWSDSRLEGTIVNLTTSGGPDVEVADGIEPWFDLHAFAIENDGGAWRTRPQLRFDFDFDPDVHPWMLAPEHFWWVLDGEDAYEGLVAVLLWERGIRPEVHGFIVASDSLPAAPEGDIARGVTAQAVDDAGPSSSGASETIDALRGLGVEVVRPGIYRILDDRADHPLGLIRQVDVAPDGTVWAATEDGTMFVVGEPGSFNPETDGYQARVSNLIALSDSAVVVHDGSRITSWDGTTWTQRALPFDARLVVRLVVEADGGALWVLLKSDEGPTGRQLVRLGREDEFFALSDLGIDTLAPASASSLTRTPDGSIWLGLAGGHGAPSGGLVRFDGESWSTVDPFGDGEPFAVWDLEVGPNGVLSGRLFREGEGFPVLGRWDGSAWTMDPIPDAQADRPQGPDRSQWPAGDWLRWWPRDEEVDYAFPGPFTNANITSQAVAPDGSEWMVLSVEGPSPVPDTPTSGLYVVDRAAAAASIPDYRFAGRHGLVPLMHPRFETKGGGDGDKRARWAQKLGTDIVAEVFAVGDRWYAGLDSVGPAGNKWIQNNSVGTGATPRAAIKDALRKEEQVTFVHKAARSALLEWPSRAPKRS